MAPDYKKLKDTLDYLVKLGVNAIELMPINEFEGNLSWGYNPAFFFAPDKYYVTPEALKALVNECHNRVWMAWKFKLLVLLKSFNVPFVPFRRERIES